LVLVADDDPGVRSIVTRVLERHGFQTLAADDGEQSVQMAMEYHPTLIILDITMPHMDGYTALTRLRGHPRTREIPVIILTGQAEWVYHDLSKGLGALEHLTKPFNTDNLVQTIRRLLPGRGE
jgi:chemosensory pili system protein ChpA (sensor histidine kinase/response regulator)